MPSEPREIEAWGPDLEENRPRVPSGPQARGGKTTKTSSIEPTTTSTTIDTTTSSSYSKLLKVALLWHVRLGHLSLRLLKKTTKITSGMPNLDSIKEVDFQCSACNKAKATRKKVFQPIPDPPNVLDSIEGDTLRIKPIPHNKLSVCLLLVDRKSRYRWVLLLPNKEGPTILNTIKGLFKGLKNKYGKYPTKFHFDGGNEVNSLLQAWLAKKGIDFSTSNPYTHEQNGLAERSIRVILDRVRATMVLLQLPQYLWCYILPSIVELVNSTAVTNRDLTPYQVLLDELEPEISHRPDLGRYKAIGSNIELLIPHEKRSKSLKLQPRTEAGRLLAVLGSETYLVWIPARRVVVKSSFVKIVDEVDTIYSVTTALETPSNSGYKEENTVREGVEEDIVDIEEDPTPIDTILSRLSQPTKLPTTTTTTTVEQPIADSNSGLNSEPKRPSISTDIEAEPSFSPLDDQLSMDIDEPINTQDSMQLDYSIANLLIDSAKAYCFRATSTTSSEPQTLKQVLKNQDKDLWLKAIYSEFDQLVSQGTFKFLPYTSLPPGRRPLTSRLVLKAKKDKNNQIVKYKARLVARGFQQIEGLDYNETFASTTIPPSWRILLAIAAVEDWEVEQIDFIGAFLNGELDEDIYMLIPEGFIDFASNSSRATKRLLKKQGYNPEEKQVILLSKALYGLKQSPRLWQTKLSRLLREEGFEPLVSDSAIFYNPKARIFVITYVDDCLLIGPNYDLIQAYKRRFNKVFAIEDRGPASFFLGVQIERDRQNRLLYIHQSQYIEEAIRHFGLENSRLLQIPLQPGVIAFKAKEGSPIKKADHKLYQKLVGTVMYLMVQTRPDIAFTVQWLSRAMAKPTIVHLNAAKGLLRFLNNYKKLVICYGQKEVVNTTTIVPSKGLLVSRPSVKTEGALKLIGFSDSDYAGDKKTSLSTYGYLFKLAGGPVSWKSKRASTITLSTVEAESDAFVEAIREAQWLIGFFRELERPIIGPLRLFGDNTGSITTAHDPALHQRTKHTLLKFHYIREQVKKGVVAISYIDTNHMPADGLTKALNSFKFRAFIDLLGLKKL